MVFSVNSSEKPNGIETYVKFAAKADHNRDIEC